MKVRDILNLIEAVEISIDLPVTQVVEQLYHVGTLDINSRRNNSHEGRGLSISTEPDAWVKINRGLTTGNLYNLSKSGHKFIDMLEINKEHYEQIFKWGIEKGYISQDFVYIINYYDDELDDNVFIEITDSDELSAELEMMDMIYDEAIENGTLEVNDNSYTITDKFKAATGSEHKDLIVSLYCQEENIPVDGLYWDEELSISKYSAPRGVIFDNRVSSWDITKVTII
ncbi:hypothetical protein B9J93_03795 [Vibrio sp. V17_P4S1T151]|uniref:hypothetical protein n=1 Tax=unclassified Vibrio TaxID=2614977 RepID=UPI000B8E9CE7|nr:MULTISPECIES: hypothetical protein [unclassified Vibrio]OXX48857.1 hypothetical protein B9J93_03795 [Vibrio sp. V17_P4S1T151]OXX65155.1 hypothetical protein B9J89_04510 [Vibrio sp. V15_P4S5T153]